MTSWKDNGDLRKIMGQADPNQCSLRGLNVATRIDGAKAYKTLEQNRTGVRRPVFEIWLS